MQFVCAPLPLQTLLLLALQCTAHEDVHAVAPAAYTHSASLCRINHVRHPPWRRGRYRTNNLSLSLSWSFISPALSIHPNYPFVTPNLQASIYLQQFLSTLQILLHSCQGSITQFTESMLLTNFQIDRITDKELKHAKGPMMPLVPSHMYIAHHPETAHSLIR